MMSLYAVNGKEPVEAWIPSLDTAGNGTTTLTDLVGSSNGTLTDMDAATDWVADTDAGGVRALEFDGTDDHVVMASDGGLLSTGVWSITAWVYWVGASGHAYGFGDSTTTSRYCSMLANLGSLQFNLVGPSQGTTTFTAGSLPVGWHQVTLTMSSSGAAVYVNGSSVSLTVISGVNNQKTWSAGQMNRFAIGALVRSTTAAWSAIRADDIRIFNTALDSSDIAALYIRGRGATNVITPTVAVNGKTPVAAWVPSISRGDWGSTRLTDLVGSNNGTLTNMDAATDWVADTDSGGVRALDFDGTNDHVIAADSADLRLLDQWSLNVWVNPTLLKNYGNVVWKSNAANTRGYGLITFATGVWYWQRNGAAILAGTIVNGAWSMLTATFDGTTLRLYTDGTEDYSGAYLPLVSGTDPLRIGADDDDNRYFNGQIDDIRIWNQSLDATDVAYLYNSGNGRGITNSPAVTYFTGIRSYNSRRRLGT
jgi:hypothetical protein